MFPVPILSPWFEWQKVKHTSSPPPSFCGCKSYLYSNYTISQLQENKKQETPQKSEYPKPSEDDNNNDNASKRLKD